MIPKRKPIEPITTDEVAGAGEARGQGGPWPPPNKIFNDAFFL